MKIRFQMNYANSHPWEIYAWDEKSGERIPYKVRLERLEPVGEAEVMEPSATVSKEAMRSLTTELRHAMAGAGLLAECSEVEGELRATKAHLADLQKAYEALLRLAGTF